MLCLSGFELYSRWVPLSYEELWRYLPRDLPFSNPLNVKPLHLLRHDYVEGLLSRRKS